MKILLTNDDGISGEGLRALYDILSPLHDVLVIAPDRNRSGVSNALIMFEPLKITKITDDMYSYAGMPADCVTLGLLGSTFFSSNFKPDVVVSGINRGANLGTDMVYSGTAGAARQAALLGVPGIAVSLAGDEYNDGSPVWNYKPLACFVADNIEKLVSYASDNFFVNINGAAVSAYTGYSFTVLSRRDYHDFIQIQKDEANNENFGVFSGGVVTSAEEPCGNKIQAGALLDTVAVRDRKISITCVHAHPSAEIPHGTDQCLFDVKKGDGNL